MKNNDIRRMPEGGWRMAEGGAKREEGISLSSLPSPLSPSRRGVLLLVVLALLAIFSLVAVAFVVLTGQAQRSAKSVEQIGRITDSRQNLLKEAAMQVFRGPTTNSTTNIPNPASVMGAHSLLEDIYGNDWVSGSLSAAATPQCGGQLLEFTPTLSATLTTTEIAKRGGCVLTIKDVPTTATDLQKALIGQSTRIVAITPGSATGNFQVMAFPNGAVPPLNTAFVINGVPFSGTGFGWDSATGALNLEYTTDSASAEPQPKLIASGTNQWPVALLPNLPLSVYYNNATNPLGKKFGGANEDYDAADFQNMLLAAQVVNGTTLQTLPSMHRPALIRYWGDKQNTKNEFTTEMLRAIMMRPIGVLGTTSTSIKLSSGETADHPNFDGSNPNFNPAWDGVTAGQGQWDVDNDGDGVMDSVWVDLGMPVRTMTDGRLYKPLFAILCVDLDGRLNLNAHGSLAQTDTTFISNIGTTPFGNVFAGGSVTTAGGTMTISANYPRGVGFGPAEVSLNALLNNNNTVYQRLLTGGTISGTTYEGRYGSSKVAGGSGTDVIAANNWFDYGSNYWNFSAANNAGSYGSPPDPFGVGAVGLDQAGRPVYVGMTYNSTDYLGFGSGTQNNPYEVDLGPNAPRGQATGTNNLFSPAEMERLLRPYDRDATNLPSRLAAITSASGGSLTDSVLLGTWAAGVFTPDPNKQQSFTTDSWDVPCQSGPAAKRILQVLEDKGIPKAKWSELLPSEMLVGLKMNINRPFGNGRADPTSGVVDDPDGTTSQSFVLSGTSGTTTVSTFSFDGHSVTAPSPINSLEARQREARYLYVLACLTADLSSIKDHLGATATYDDVARFLAQWAVNAVDFKDRDSIMTRFDYDKKFADPATTDFSAGWVPTTTGSCTVWGCERPELLISETLAFHDLRIKDTNLEADASVSETDDKKAALYSAASPDHDASFDQAYRPQGSLFIEFYNPQSPLEPHSRDFYDAANSGVELTKISGTSSEALHGSPVWRVLIVAPVAGQTDPDDPNTANQPITEREVYFVASSTATIPTTLTNANGRFCAGTASGTVTIPPCGYAVVGSGENDPTSQNSHPNRTYIGFITGQAAGSSTTHYIDISGSTSTGTSYVEENNNASGTNTRPSTTLFNAPMTLAVTSPKRLSVSEPITAGATYDDLEIATNKPNDNGEYVTPYDVPFDSFTTTGTTAAYRMLYLQRLANPLLAYHATTNPYRTIDQMAVDLTVFNGVADPVTGHYGSSIQAGTCHFETRQRGENNGTTTGTALNLWKQESLNKTAGTSSVALSPAHYFNESLKHSLGYLNQTFGTATTITKGTVVERGLPASPFPWLTWNNRPYVSPLELTLVPWVRSSQLLVNYNTAQTGSPYGPSNYSTGNVLPFPHLVNFFESGTPSVPDVELHRLFGYLTVPSPFVGTKTWANPTSATAPYLPPFNAISSYREPGRINLNTIYSKDVFDGLMAGGATTTWDDFRRNRRGDPTTTDILAMPAATVPTEFARPFRSIGGTNTVPIAALQTTSEIDATLLRSDGSTINPPQPLFNFTSANDSNNTDRNPYFRYQGMQRLANLTTTRSNVYAVWITVGYFEVTPVTTANVTRWPDGYQLGRELGIDTGEIERHRAFYIFDRTLPVGFQRGQDLNVDKAILVNRYVE